MIRILKEFEAGAKVAETCRKHGISEPACGWKSQYAGLEVSQLRHLKDVEGELARMKRMYVDPRSGAVGRWTCDAALADLCTYLERLYNPRMRRRLTRRGQASSDALKPCADTGLNTRSTNSRESSRIFWWAHQDSNLEPKDYESSALTIELWARGWQL